MLLSVVTGLSGLVYIGIVVLCTITEGSVKVNEVEVVNPFARLIIAAMIFPFFGLVLYALGWFILLPFFALLGMSP